MTIKEIRQLTNLSQRKFCEKYGIPLQTLCKWEQGHRTCSDYVVELLEFKVREDLKMKELRIYLNSEIAKAEKLLKEEQQKREENRNNPMFDNETSITCIVSMLVAYRNVLDKIAATD